MTRFSTQLINAIKVSKAEIGKEFELNFQDEIPKSVATIKPIQHRFPDSRVPAVLPEVKAIPPAQPAHVTLPV
jgi:hypothetical protein